MIHALSVYISIYVRLIVAIFPSVETDDWNFSGEDGQDVRGHIVATGFRFYQLCPVDQREDWFHAYKRSDFKCLT